jgi:ribosomal-protein-alanine N-acetyltransferase
LKRQGIQKVSARVRRGTTMLNQIQLPMNSFPELETGNLRLRELVPTDAEAVYRIYADDRVTRFYDLDTFDDVRQATELIRRQRARFQRGEGLRWGITQRENNVIIGTAGYVFSQHNAQGGIGYDLARPYWRKGIMSEALLLVIHYGFSSLKLNRIQALVIPGNRASVGLLMKLGFQEEGLLRDYAFFKGRYNDLISFALLRRDYG